MESSFISGNKEQAASYSDYIDSNLMRLVEHPSLDYYAKSMSTGELSSVDKFNTV